MLYNNPGPYEEHTLFYCSFTQLPNIEDLPYTIHSRYSIDKKMPSRVHHHRRRAQRPRSTGVESFVSRSSSTSSSSSFTSFFSSSSATRSSSSSSAASSSSSTTSSRRHKLLAKMKLPFENMFPTKSKRRGVFMLTRHNKPSTLDFRCIGMEDDFYAFARVSSVHLGSMVTAPTEATSFSSSADFDGAPRLNWKQPAMSTDNSDWFDEIN